MSSFRDLLNGPLPSQIKNAEINKEENITTESTEVAEENFEGLQTDTEEGTDPELDDMANNEDSIDTDDIEDVSNDNDFNPDNLSDEELAELDSELSGQAVDDVAGAADLPEEKLTPEEELRADDMMQVAATSMLVNDELNAEERVAFINSGEANIAIEEGFLTDTDANMIAESVGLVTEANNYNQKMIIRLDAASKKKQLFALGVRVSAAAHNDPDYKKYKKVMKIKKILNARMTQKYRGEATKRMKIYFNRLRKSKSKTLSGIAAKNSDK